MTLRDAMWDVFVQTGHIGAYLMYKDCQRMGSQEEDFSAGDSGTES